MFIKEFDKKSIEKGMESGYGKPNLLEQKQNISLYSTYFVYFIGWKCCCMTTEPNMRVAFTKKKNGDWYQNTTETVGDYRRNK